MKKCFILLTFILATANLQAQPTPAPPPGGGAEAAPLDGFTWTLLLSGAGYAAHSLRKRKKKGSAELPES